jgi:hypothetical protein
VAAARVPNGSDATPGVSGAAANTQTVLQKAREMGIAPETLVSSRVRVGAFLTKTGKKDPWIAAF